ncbi:hypothetical protein [Microbispora sp. CSR-4]|uniref:hypothetical protein n=1 Tax=Microbispora sp. CSR-4 TaxID=2592813 RepID=UPI0011CAA51A|nr:hypothetical protein [Microbispora sp. CSR-4]
MNLFLVTGAWRSAVDSGQDVVETLMRVNEPHKALNLLDRQLLPVAEQCNLPDLIVGLRSQRAVVLAYTGDIMAARAEINNLRLYEATPEQADDIRHQTYIIEHLSRYRPVPPSSADPSN